MLQRLTQSVLQILDKLAFLVPLITRIVLGLAFYLDGQGKWNNLDKVIQFFTSLGIPFPAANATFISLLEFAGGAFLVAGLATRLFAFLLSCTMVTAILTSDHQALAEKFPADFTDVASFTYLLFLLWLLFYGPGPISLDWLIGRFMNRQK
jgi:putative oxidoreductase